MVFSGTKVANIGQQDKRVLLYICIWLYHHSDSSAMTDYRCMFSTSDRHRKLNQLRWQNMSAQLTNETYYWLKKLLLHLNWAIYNACDPRVCFFPTLSTDRARPIPLAQPEACPQRSERPVCARSPHRSLQTLCHTESYLRFHSCRYQSWSSKHVSGSNWAACEQLTSNR